MKVPIGAMDQQITLQRRQSVPDGAGGQTVTWGNLPRDAHPWANVIAKAGGENVQDGRMTASFKVLFTVHHRSDLVETDRILWNGEPYNIRGIRRETGRALRLVIEAERGVQQ